MNEIRELLWSYSSLVDFLINILADAFVAASVILFGWYVLGKGRRKLHRFFGITRNRPLTLYLSAMEAEKGSLKDRQGQKTQHEGVVISDYEFHTILPISNLFLSDATGSLPYLLANLFEQNTLVKKTNIDFEVSPKDFSELQFGNMICLGTDLFNAATGYYWHEGLPILQLYLDPKTDKWTMKRFQNEKVVLTIRPEDLRQSKGEADRWNIGIITKSIDQKHNCTVFIVAGTGKNGTRAAVNYLVDHWREFDKQFGKQEFGVAIQCIKYPVDPLGYETFREIGRWEKSGD